MDAQAHWRRIGLVGRLLAAVISAAVLISTAYGWWTVGQVDANTVHTDVIDSDPDTRVPLDGAVDILLVGMDSRTDAYGNPLPREVLDMLHAGRDDGERNTDTMILVHIPIDGRRATAISFPRDSWVELAGGFGKHKLNSALANAYEQTHDQLARQELDAAEVDRRATVAGRRNLIATIQTLVGDAVSIDRYAEVNLASFYEVTNAIGGVEVCLREPVKDSRSGADFTAGRQTIAGAQALAFVRQRYGLPNGDLDRIVRQQVFLGALADRVLSADMLTSPAKARSLIAAVQRSVVLSSGWELSRFAAQLQGLSAGSIDFHTIPTRGLGRAAGQDILVVDPAEVRSFVSGLIGSSGSTRSPGSTSVTPTVTNSVTPSRTVDPATTSAAAVPAPLVVDVLDGSNTGGLAASVSKVLVDRGYRLGGTGSTPVRGTSVIRHAPDETFAAELIAVELGGDFTAEEDGTLAPGHVRVLLGTDYRAPSDSFAGARLAPTLTSTTSSPSGTTSGTAPTKINAGGVTCVN